MLAPGSRPSCGHRPAPAWPLARPVSPPWQRRHGASTFLPRPGEHQCPWRNAKGTAKGRSRYFVPKWRLIGAICAFNHQRHPAWMQWCIRLSGIRTPSAHRPLPSVQHPVAIRSASDLGRRSQPCRARFRRAKESPAPPALPPAILRDTARSPLFWLLYDTGLKPWTGPRPKRAADKAPAPPVVGRGCAGFVPVLSHLPPVSVASLSRFCRASVAHGKRRGFDRPSDRSAAGCRGCRLRCNATASLLAEQAPSVVWPFDRVVVEASREQPLRLAVLRDAVVLEAWPG